MKVRRIRVPRRPPWPWWAVFVSLIWLALGGANLLLAEARGYSVQLCLFKHVTGCPCPTCGFTRGTLAFLQGHPVEAWLHNPLLFSFLGLFGAVVGFRLLFGQSLRVELAPAGRRATWVVLSVLFVVNWLYVIRCVG